MVKPPTPEINERDNYRFPNLSATCRPSLGCVPFRNGAAPFWNIYFFNIKVYLHKLSKFIIKFFFILNDMIYVVTKLGSCPVLRLGKPNLESPILQDWLAQTWNFVTPPYTATKVINDKIINF